MSSRGEKSFQEKFRNWFKSSKAAQALPLKDEVLVLTPDIVVEIGIETDVAKRLSIIRDLTPAVECQRLQDHGVELLLMKTRDLTSSPDAETRRCLFAFYQSLVRGQFEKLGAMRAYFFRIIESHKEMKADFEELFVLLDALTQQGRKIEHFQEKLGPFLFRLFPLALEHEKRMLDFLRLLHNMITYNPSSLDPEVVHGVIGYLGHICVAHNAKGVVEICLECFHGIMGFSYIPKEALPSFICTLCRVVNIEAHCCEAWRIMGNLMATHLGHSALYNLCQVMQSKENQADVALVRGAIFFIGMSLWGTKCVKKMQTYSPMTILPTFIEALNCKHHLVTYEVTLQLERLVVKRGETLRAPGCDCALDLVEALLDTIPVHGDVKVQAEIYSHLHNTISKFESLSAEKKYRGSQKKLFVLIDKCSKQRPDLSVIRLLEYRSQALYPTKSGWIATLHDLMDKYFKNDTRDAVRIKCLRVMSEIVRANRHMYEQDLLEKIVIPFMKTLDGEASTTVRVVGVQVLTQLLSECSSRDCLTLLDVLERVVTKPLEKKKQQTEDENDMADVHAAVKGLINIFRVKLCQQPPAVIARIYGILSQHLEDNYRHPVVFAKAGHVRVEIFQLFMALRVSESWHLGMCEGGGDGGVVRFSPFIVVKDVVGGAADGPPAVVERHKSGSQSSVLYISLTRACRLVIQSLSEEKDWNVLQLVLARVPNVLQNKAIITRYGKAIQSFVLPLVDLTSRECKLPDGLINKPPGLNRSEFHNRVFPVLAAMASFNEYLESAAQREMINSLHTGLLSKDCNRICISALTACALEMKRSMYHVIPQVLLNFSKISATKMIASPMLEFLSTLIRLPDIFSSFTDTNYMSVFAIALPFTNPFKFDAYIVSLAHHIIIMWFLKCRLCYRQNFVQFIVTGLNSNVRHAAAVTAAAAAAPPPIAPSKQPGQGGGDESGGSGFRQRSTTNAVQTAAAGASAAVALKLLKNMDSAERKRSSSLTDSSSSSRRQSGSGKAAEPTEEQKRIMKIVSFHEELTETCVDILARYMFANAAVQTKRLPTTDFLLKQGNSATWLLNTMLITVTTSLCDQAANRGGLCDRCHLICSKNARPLSENIDVAKKDVPAPPSPDVDDGSGARVRHQSEFHVQKPSPSRYLPGSSAKDDFDLRRQMSSERISSYTGGTAAGTGSNREGQGEEMGKLEKLLKEQKENGSGGGVAKKPETCACWCSGWAEIYIRRPSGDVSWMCRIQNSSLVSDSHGEFPLADLTALFQPTKDIDVRSGIDAMLDNSKRIPVESLTEIEYEALTTGSSGEQSYSILHRLPSTTGEVEEQAKKEDNLQQPPPSPQPPVKEEARKVAPSDPQSTGEAAAAVVPRSEDKPAKEKEEGGSGSNRQSACNPIMEVAEEEDPAVAILRKRENVQEILRRRQSLQVGVEDALRRQVATATSSPKARQSPLSRSRQESSTPPSAEVSNASPGVAVRPRNTDSAAMGGPRDRAHTISGPSPIRSAPSRDPPAVRRGPDFLRNPSMTAGAGGGGGGGSGGSGGGKPREERVTGISPQFVFLQLYHLSCFGNVGDAERPVMLPTSTTIETSIRNLDRIHAHETHKIGVVYVGPGQESDETAILTNAFGSLRYTQFLHGLGSLVSLKDIDKKETYVGGLDHRDGDGDFAYIWEDDVMQVTFHVATLMPAHEKDPKGVKKKRHIGNDFVAIAYNNSGGRYERNTVKCQFMYACVVIVPLDHGSNKVHIECKPELNEPLGHIREPKIVSDRNLAILVRQLALHCNLAAQIQRTLGSGRDPYSSNWLERLRQIKRIRAKVTSPGAEEGGRSSSPPAQNDFTRLVTRKVMPDQN